MTIAKYETKVQEIKANIALLETRKASEKDELSRSACTSAIKRLNAQINFYNSLDEGIDTDSLIKETKRQAKADKKDKADKAKADKKEAKKNAKIKKLEDMLKELKAK